MADSTTPPAILAMIDATNRGDTDAFVQTFTEDAHIVDFGREFHGHDGARSWDSTDNIGVGMHFDLLSVEAAGADEYHATVDARSRRFTGRATLRVRVRDGLISFLDTA